MLFGTGLGTAFHGLASNLRGDLRAIVVGNRNVVLADWLFTTPAVIVQPVTGVLLALDQGWPLDTPWLLAAIALYLFVAPAGCRSSGCKSAWRASPSKVSRKTRRCRRSMEPIFAGGSRWAGRPSSP